MMHFKKYFTYSLILLSTLTYAQEIKERHIRKLKNLDVTYKTDYVNNERINQDLHQLLHYDFKRRSRNAVGTALAAVGVSGLAGGFLLVGTKNSYGEGSILYSTLGVGCILVGTASIGTSIPIFIGARKNRKKRDQLRAMYSKKSTNPFLAISEQ
ncbi:MAG: hypothetical protein Mars2KO_45320 [Maribacter sp.]